MKSLYIIILFTAIYSSCLSQIVIEGSNFIQPGTILNYQSGSPIWNASTELININGDSAVWNADDWTSVTDQTDIFHSVDDMPAIIKFFFSNESLYPDHFSTHALQVDADLSELPIPIELSDVNAYFRTDETGYYNTGLSFAFQGFPLTAQNSEVERIYKFPMHYGDVDSTTLAYIVSLPTLGAYGQNAQRYSVVDGRGMLTTPYGTYEVLRVRSERLSVDTVYVEMAGLGQTIERPLQIDYAWISPQKRGPILEMSVVENLVISSRMLFNQSAVNVSGLEKQNLEIYPNPARDFIVFSAPFAGKATVEMYDIHGRLVLTALPEDNRIQVNSLPAGLYILRVLENQKAIRVGKILIIE